MSLGNSERHQIFVIFLSLFFIIGYECLTGSTNIVRASEEAKKTLIIYNWEDYIGSETIAGFEKETGIHVKEVFFQNEEETLGAVQSEPGAYDLVVTSDDMVREMREARLLSKLEVSKIPNLKHINKKYLNLPHDPEQKYSVPYLWGTTGLAVNKKYITENSDSLKVLFDERYKGKIAVLSDGFEVIGNALKVMGLSINEADPEKLAEAKEMLLKQKPLLRGYLDVTTIKDMMIKEKLWAAQIYSGEGMVAADENENIEYVIPKEGAPIYLDIFVLLRDAPNREEAHLFLNYILRPEVNAKIASELWYATANKAAEPFVDPEVIQSPSVYPSPEVMARCEFYKNIGKAALLIHRIWNEVQIAE